MLVHLHIFKSYFGIIAFCILFHVAHLLFLFRNTRFHLQHHFSFSLSSLHPFFYSLCFGCLEYTFILCVSLGTVEKEPDVSEGQSCFLSFELLSAYWADLLRAYIKTLRLCLLTFFPSPLIPHLSGATSPEWIGFQEAEYKFFDHRTTWDQAQRICSWFDSSLASVHSAAEEAFLANTLREVLHTSSISPSSLVGVNLIWKCS